MIKMLKPRAQLSSMVEVTAVKCTGITVKHIWHCEPMARFAPDQNRKWRHYGSPLKPWWTFVQITPRSQGLRSRVVAWHAAYSACVSWSARTLASYPAFLPASRWTLTSGEGWPGTGRPRHDRSTLRCSAASQAQIPTPSLLPPCSGPYRPRLGTGRDWSWTDPSTALCKKKQTVQLRCAPFTVHV